MFHWIIIYIVYEPIELKYFKKYILKSLYHHSSSSSSVIHLLFFDWSKKEISLPIYYNLNNNTIYVKKLDYCSVDKWLQQINIPSYSSIGLMYCGHSDGIVLGYKDKIWCNFSSFRRILITFNKKIKIIILECCWTSTIPTLSLLYDLSDYIFTSSSYLGWVSHLLLSDFYQPAKPYKEWFLKLFDDYSNHPFHELEFADEGTISYILVKCDEFKNFISIFSEDDIDLKDEYLIYKNKFWGYDLEKVITNKVISTIFNAMVLGYNYHQRQYPKPSKLIYYERIPSWRPKKIICKSLPSLCYD